MNDSYSRLSEKLKTCGAAAAVESLVVDLREKADYPALFYALLMKARVEMGVSPFPMGPSGDLPETVHEAYEEAIRSAAREVGHLYLTKQDLLRAWGYFRLINEPQPVKDALETFIPDPDEEIYPILDLAWHQRVHPARGFDLLLDRLGICSAITTLGSTDLSNDATLKARCIRKLIDALHAQLIDRLSAEMQFRKLEVPAIFNEILRDIIFEDDTCHIDASHLASVAQMSLELPPRDPALPKARDLCAYGVRLAPGFRGGGDSPFEDTYNDYAIFLDILAGDVAGLPHFESKIVRNLEEGNTFPAEVYINLLVRLDMLSDALAAAKRYLKDISSETSLSCPGVIELARRLGDFPSISEMARVNGDTVTFLAGLIAASNSH